MTTATDKLKTRIAALLAQAQGTTFEEEADAFMAKAQALMTEHAITEAMLPGARERDKVTTKAVQVIRPYASAKGSLLTVLAEVNDVQCVRVKGGADHDFILIGFESDIANVQTLFASLEMQATGALLAACKAAGDNGSAFKHAFLLGFSGRVYDRLAAAKAAAVAQYETASGTSTALVLADRTHEVDELVRETFPRLRRTRMSASSGTGYGAGEAAGARADVGSKAVGGRAALTS